MPASIEISHLGFSYGRGITALTDVSLSVGQGEVVGLVGPNGSGKSTLIKLAFDMLEVQVGDIHLGGDAHHTIAAKLSAIYLPSDDDLPDFLTGNEYMELMCHTYHLPVPSAQQVEEQFAGFGMAGRQHDLIEDYSHGMRKKVQLICAAIVRRPLTVIDETMNGVDLDAIERSVELITSMREDDHSVLLCTHDFALMSQVANRIVMLRDGEVLAELDRGDFTDATDLTQMVSNLLCGEDRSLSGGSVP